MPIERLKLILNTVGIDLDEVIKKECNRPWAKKMAKEADYREKEEQRKKEFNDKIEKRQKELEAQGF